MVKVNIVPSERRGWIIGRIISELSNRNGWSVGNYDPNREANLFVNYHAALPWIGSLASRNRKNVAAAFLTHIESTQFFDVARLMDVKLCMAPKYARLIDGVVVNLGVDPVFNPTLRVGVVGRDYTSGRKGGRLVAALEDIDFISIVRPQPVGDFDSDRSWLLHLNEFYSSLDVFLVPSLVEGGPVPAAEAIACGTEVVAPCSVGNMELLPVTSFEAGNLNDLINVLREKFLKKKIRAEAVQTWTWERFASQVRLLIEIEIEKKSEK